MLQFQQTEQFFKKTYFDSLPKEHNFEDNCNNFIEQSSTDESIKADQQYDDSSESVLEHSVIPCRESQSEEEYKYYPNSQNVVSNIYRDEFYNKIDFTKIIHRNEVFVKKSENEDDHVECIIEKKDPLFNESATDKLIEETETEIISESFKYSCTECGDLFLYKPGFNQHMLQRHNKHLREEDYAQYSSKIIVKQPKMFPEFIKITKTTLKNVDNQLQCRICKKCFENDSELKEHVNVHKTHVCPVCGLAFLKKYYLTDHLVVHSSQRNYVCHICNANFRHRNALTAHKNSHKNFRDYICESCGHSFKDKGTLKVHIKLKHNEDRNYACSECPLKFKLKSFLDKHFIRKHTKRTKDFVCSECGVAYLNKTTLMRHISEKHSGKYPQHICAICCKSFSVKLTLNRHLQSIHKIEINKR